MKTKSLLLLIFLSVFVFVFSFAVAADTSEQKTEDKIIGIMQDAQQEVSEKTDNNIEIFSSDLENSGEALIEFLDAGQLMHMLFGITSEVFKGSLMLLLSLLGILIVSALCRSVCDAGGQGTIISGFEFLCSVSIMAAILGMQYSKLDDVVEYFEGISDLFGALIPVTGIVWAMGGNISTAAVTSSTLYMILAIIQKVCSASIIPVCFIMVISAICSGFTDRGLLDGVSSGIKKVYNFFVGFIMMLMVFVLSTQTTIASSADTVAARSGKLIISTVIPGIGGSIADTLRTVAGSVGYIKGVVGIGGIVLLAMLTLPVLISLLMSRLAVIISSTVAEMLGCRRESKLLGEISNIYGFLVGAVSISAVTLTVAMGIFVKCTVAIE